MKKSLTPHCERPPEDELLILKALELSTEKKMEQYENGTPAMTRTSGGGPACKRALTNERPAEVPRERCRRWEVKLKDRYVRKESDAEKKP